MKVRLFKLGGHEYIFSINIIRKDIKKEKPLFDKRAHAYKKTVCTADIPKNKYCYTRKTVSKNIGLKNYSIIMANISEILEYISTDFESSTVLVSKLQEHVLKDKVKIDSSILNLIARIHESTPIIDKHGRKWQLVVSGWGLSTAIKKQGVKR